VDANSETGMKSLIIAENRLGFSTWGINAVATFEFGEVDRYELNRLLGVSALLAVPAFSTAPLRLSTAAAGLELPAYRRLYRRNVWATGKGSRGISP
jgi:hypothetical protein